MPVPVEEFIEGPLGYGFEVRDLSYLGPDVIGSACCETPSSIAVSDRIENQDGRFRFTCAHELGHIVMHRDIGLRFDDDDDEKMLIRDHGLEAQANRFAARFLMPWAALELEVMRAFRHFKMDPLKFVPIMLGSNEHSVWVWKYRIVPRITQRFRVSLSAAIYRFNAIKLPDGCRFLFKDIIYRLMTNDLSIRRVFRGMQLVPTG